jgi:hypothetical protein
MAPTNSVSSPTLALLLQANQVMHELFDGPSRLRC